MLITLVLGAVLHSTIHALVTVGKADRLAFLLQQSLNMLQGETKPIRRTIEGRFDEIKVITESSRPMLPASLSHWLQEVTWVCREEVQACPGYTHKRVAPVARLIKGNRR